MIPITDTHLHLIYQDEFAYDWCADVPALNKDFKVEDYIQLSEGHGIAGSIFMEVDVAESDISEEAAFFSNLVAQANNPLVGVIAACRPEKSDFQELLEATLTDSTVGLRRVLHVVPDEMSQSSQFRENIQSLVNYSLPFDLCFGQNQHETAYELIKACPENQFVLDHCGGPDIDQARFHDWKRGLEKIASLPNVVCKVSGIIASCPTRELATLETLRPWIETTVEAFGSDRILIGSDWPVCDLTSDLPSWLTMVREHFSSHTTAEQTAIFHANAKRIYGV